MKEITATEFNKIMKDKNINVNKLNSMLVEELIKQKKTVATAESCTGGLISKSLTDVSGAGHVFHCGVCSYANEIKHKVLGVKQETLDAVGAVSPEVAEQMAKGVRKLANSDYGVATTGIAGPTGGTLEKPIGLVYIAVNSVNETIVIKADLTEEEKTSRENIRKNAKNLAIFTLLSELCK